MEVVPDIDAIEADINNVSEARLKLDDILDEIMQKDEESVSDDEANRRTGIGSSSATPSKRHYSARVPRKKKKKESFYEGGVDWNKPSYIIKLFDRRVDLAQFGESTPLYAMLREWMKNRPSTSESPSSKVECIESDDVITTSEVQEPPMEEEPVDNGLCELPGPIDTKDSRYPLPLPPALKNAMVEDIINTEDDIEELRKDNMVRWRKVRSRWKEYSLRQQERYIESLVLLKKTFHAQATG